MKKITIAIADDHIVFRQGLNSLFLNHFREIEVLFHVGNGKELLEKLTISRPDVILLDVDMPVMNGSEALIQVMAKYPTIKVIMLSFHFGPVHVIDHIRTGASAYLAKECGIEPIVDAIKAVQSQGYYYDNISQIISNDNVASFSCFKDIKLTKRESEILDLIKVRKTDNEIAEILFISSRTAEWHRSNLIHKTGAKNTQELIDWAKKLAGQTRPQETA